MVLKKKSKVDKLPSLRVKEQARISRRDECIDRTPVFIETSSDGQFLKPIILVEDGVAKITKYCIRRTKKGTLRLE